MGNKKRYRPSKGNDTAQLTGAELVEHSIRQARQGGITEAASYITIIDFLNSIYSSSEKIDSDEIARQRLRKDAQSTKGISIRGKESSASILLKFAMGMDERKSRRSSYNKVFSNAKRLKIEPENFKSWIEDEGGIEACSKLNSSASVSNVSDYNKLFEEHFGVIDKQQIDVSDIGVRPGLQLLLVNKPENDKAQFLHSFNNEGLINQAVAALVKLLGLESMDVASHEPDNSSDVKKVAEVMESDDE